MAAKGQAITPAYLWFDAEFTSLDPDQARLLQVAMLVTDTGLRRLTAAERDVNLCIRLEPGVAVSQWVEEHLAGLLRKCRSGAAVPVEEADRRLAGLVDEAVGPAAEDMTRRPVLAGNSVHMDMVLVRRFLPEFARRLHYRVLDVSTMKILWKDWAFGAEFDKDQAELIERYAPEGLRPPTGAEHDAYYDIHASLAELNYYRQGWKREWKVGSRTWQV